MSSFYSKQHELSHHLAHAYSAATQSPFSSGMVVIMDGMGETYRAMLNAQVTNDKSYTSDLDFGMDTFECIPSDLKERSQYSNYDFREAESVYVFEKKEHAINIKVRLDDRRSRSTVRRSYDIISSNNVVSTAISPCLNALHKNIRRRRYIIMVLKTWIVPVPCIHVLRHIFLVIGMLVEK